MTGTDLAELTVLLGGARGLALRVWDAGWRPCRCQVCRGLISPAPTGPDSDMICGACRLTAYAMELGLYPAELEVA